MPGAIPADNRILNATGPGGAVFTSYRTSGDSTNSSNTTLSDITGLAFWAEANAEYVLQAWLLFQSAATTTGLVLTLNTPASPTHAALTYYHYTTTSGGANAAGSRADDTALGFTASVDAANSDILVPVHAIITNGTTAGLVQMRFRSEINLSQVTIRTGSIMMVSRVR